MILVVDYVPRITSASRLYQELSESFVEYGHEVTVITEHPAPGNILVPGTPKASRSSETINGVNIRRLSALSFMSAVPGGKAVRFVFSCALFFLRGLFTSKHDVVLVYSPPLFLAISGLLIARLKKIKYVFDLQDIHPKVLFDAGDIRHPFLKKIFVKMESVAYKHAASIIVYSKGNREYLLERDVKCPVDIIPNWIDEAMMTVSMKSNTVMQEYAKPDQFILTYAGTMQAAQSIDIVVDVAKQLQDYPEIKFLLAGDGSSKEELAVQIAQDNLSNIQLLPVLPRHQYVEFLYGSDVCLLPLGKDTPLQTVPGKLADLMTSRNPIIAAVNKQGDAAAIIEKVGCGIVVSPGDVKAFAAAVLELYKHQNYREQMGEKGRKYAEQNYSRSSCTKKYAETLKSANL